MTPRVRSSLKNKRKLCSFSTLSGCRTTYSFWEFPLKLSLVEKIFGFSRFVFVARFFGCVFFGGGGSALGAFEGGGGAFLFLPLTAVLKFFYKN